MNSFRDFAVTTYVGTRYLFRGRLKQAFVTYKASAYKLQEMVLDLVLPSRVTCNFCGWKGARFHTMVTNVWYRRNAQCPRCHSLERHREFLEDYLRVRSVLPASIHLLQVAPDLSFYQYCIKDPTVDYMTIDIAARLAMKRMDVQHLDFPDQSFDVVVCFHVLDYVEDDQQALNEIYRVLKPQGVAILQEGLPAGRITREFGRPLLEEDYRRRAYGVDLFKKHLQAGFQIDLKTGSPASPTLLALRKESLLLEPLRKKFEGRLLPELSGLRETWHTTQAWRTQ